MVVQSVVRSFNSLRKMQIHWTKYQIHTKISNIHISDYEQAFWEVRKPVLSPTHLLRTKMSLGSAPYLRDSNIGAKFLYKLKPSALMTIEWHEQNYINIREKEITSRKKPYLHQAIDCNDLLLIYIY